jgi:hypothetical protein
MRVCAYVCAHMRVYVCMCVCARTHQVVYRALRELVMHAQKVYLTVDQLRV